MPGRFSNNPGANVPPKEAPAAAGPIGPPPGAEPSNDPPGTNSDAGGAKNTSAI